VESDRRQPRRGLTLPEPRHEFVEWNKRVSAGKLSQLPEEQVPADLVIDQNHATAARIGSIQNLRKARLRHRPGDELNSVALEHPFQNCWIGGTGTGYCHFCPNQGTLIHLLVSRCWPKAKHSRLSNSSYSVIAATSADGSAIRVRRT